MNRTKKVQQKRSELRRPEAMWISILTFFGFRKQSYRALGTDPIVRMKTIVTVDGRIGGCENCGNRTDRRPDCSASCSSLDNIIGSGKGAGLVPGVR